ncbi:hypothetical protein SLEP1_g4898 [Rubroshorea leprosula]|uniref:Uncharacterized protein n=1 Tax=Rubroshorea leprosula TaxID=152421 RepID=A0AAV5HY10_9ROSI|nr:hypothetical protein SLEP1_g4898 [Rubroshorea leprosula]
MRIAFVADEVVVKGSESGSKVDELKILVELQALVSYAIESSRPPSIDVLLPSLGGKSWENVAKKEVMKAGTDVINVSKGLGDVKICEKSFTNMATIIEVEVREVAMVSTKRSKLKIGETSPA